MATGESGAAGRSSRVDTAARSGVVRRSADGCRLRLRTVGAGRDSRVTSPPASVRKRRRLARSSASARESLRARRHPLDAQYIGRRPRRQLFCSEWRRGLGCRRESGGVLRGWLRSWSKGEQLRREGERGEVARRCPDGGAAHGGVPTWSGCLGWFDFRCGSARFPGVRRLGLRSRGMGRHFGLGGWMGSWWGSRYWRLVEIFQRGLPIGAFGL